MGNGTDWEAILTIATLVLAVGTLLLVFLNRGLLTSPPKLRRLPGRALTPLWRPPKLR